MNTDGTPSSPTVPSRRLRIVLWTVAVLLMLGSAFYQRLTGPSHHRRITFTVAGAQARAWLVRSGVTTREAQVRVPAPVDGLEGTLHVRRYPTDEPFEERALVRDGDELVGYLPIQPAAGKVEYYVVLHAGAQTVRIPPTDEKPVVLRYKDPVPLAFLIPHIAFMFFAVLFGIRTGLAALFAPQEMRRLAFLTLPLVTVGGLVLGPIVQKYAFGAFWTGWPYGYDLTDNKVLIMWVVWVLLCVALLLRRPRREGMRRGLVLAATVVMLVVYLVPHSLRGSELDYNRLNDGVAPKDAIRTG